MFTGTLQGPYPNRMVGSGSSGFLDLVVVGEKLKIVLRVERFRLLSVLPLLQKSLTLCMLKIRKEKLMSFRLLRGRLKHIMSLITKWL